MTETNYERVQRLSAPYRNFVSSVSLTYENFLNWKNSSGESEEHIKLKLCGAKILLDLGYNSYQIYFEKVVKIQNSTIIVDCVGIRKTLTSLRELKIAIECGNTRLPKIIALLEEFDFVIHLPYEKVIRKFLTGCGLFYKFEGGIDFVKLDMEDYYLQIKSLSKLIDKSRRGKGKLSKKILIEKLNKYEVKEEIFKANKEGLRRERKEVKSETLKLLKLRKEMQDIYGPHPLSQTKPLLEKLYWKLKYTLFQVNKIRFILDEYEPLTEHYMIKPKVFKQLTEEDNLRDNLSSLKESTRTAYNTLFYALESPTSNYSCKNDIDDFNKWCNKLVTINHLDNLVKNREGYWREL